MNIASRINRKFLQVLLNPRLQINKIPLPLKSFGSKYGGWVLCDSDSLLHATIVSCGLGEDASFDVEIASHFDLKILIIDPTPRAIAHFEEIISSLGKSKEANYSDGGVQSTKSYDLTKLSSSSLKLIPKAIWVNDYPVKFYHPPTEDHVSHSIVNYQNNYASNTRYIEVPAITLKQLMQNESLESIPLIKLDIEGAEVEVITSFLDEGIRPDQILVEYDELNNPSIKSRQRITSCHKKLVDHQYSLVNYSKPNNFLYVLKTAFNL